MKRKDKKYLRVTLLEYKPISGMVDDVFISETRKSVDALGEHPKLDPLTINNNCKKLDLSFYEKRYNDNLDILKKRIKIICNLPIMAACLEYNNKQLFHDFKELERLKDRKRENNVYKSLVSYINRVSFDATYGGLMGFYSWAQSVSGSNNIFKNELNLIFEKNRFLNSNKSKASPKSIYLNPTVIFNKSGVIFFKHENNREQIIKIKNSFAVNVLQAIRSHDFIKKKLNFKIRFIGEGDIKKVDKDFLGGIFKKLTEAEAIGLRSKEIYKICFKDKKNLDSKSINLNKNIKIKEGSVYDLISAGSFYVDKKVYLDFKKSAYVYLDLLERQLQGIHAEKIYLGKALKQYLEKIKKDKCLLLDFVISQEAKIAEIRKKRDTFCFSFYEKFFSKIQINKAAEKIEFNNWKAENKKIRKDLEFYFSSCRVDGKRHVLIENISPAGVFSSRFDYLVEGKSFIKDSSKVEPIEVIFTPSSPKLFHAFRRKVYTRYFLNINNYIKHSKQRVLNINEIYLVLDKMDLPTLYSPRLDKYFDPVIHSTLPVEQSRITAFLRMISRAQEEVYALPRLLPDMIDGLNYVPRIVINDLIISRRIWQLLTKDVNIIKGSMPKYNEYLYLIRLFKKKKIPRFVNLFSPGNKNVRPIDLYNPMSLLLFKKYSEEEFVYIEEMLPSPEHADHFDEKIGHLSQYYHILS